MGVRVGVKVRVGMRERIGKEHNDHGRCSIGQ